MKRRSPVNRPRILQLEFLEPRFLPSALNVTLGGTATTLIKSGDTGDVGATTIVNVRSGAALVFVTDLNSNGAYDSGELTGIAVADRTSLAVFDDVNGDIATNLDKDGTLSDGTVDDDGATLLPGTIKGLSIEGRVGKVFAGQDIINAQVDAAQEFRTGTKTNGQTIDFDATGPASITLLTFTPAAGEDGGNITDILITAGTGPLVLALGDGGDSITKNGGDAGKLDNVSVINDGDVTVAGGAGGDGFKRGGDGTQFEDFVISTNETGFAAGNDIVMDSGGGGSILDLVRAKGSAGDAGDFRRGDLSASGDVAINATGGDGGNATKQAGEGSSIELVDVTALGNITLVGTDGGSTPDGVNIEGQKGRGGVGGHVSGRLKFGADSTVLDAGGSVSLFTGSGGSGGRLGGTGGGMFGLHVVASGDVSILTGNGADFNSSTGSKKGNGGFGGSINSVLIEIRLSAGDVFLTSGSGGGGSSIGRSGGTIGFVQVTTANDVTFIAGNGGGSTDPMLLEKENTDVGGAGGSIRNNRVGGLVGNSITGNVVFIAGNGYGDTLDVRIGGAGGSLRDAVIVTDGNITLTAGNGGEADDDNNDFKNAVGGLGGFIDPIELTGANITVRAGTGGHGVTGGRGGFIDDLEIDASAEVNLFGGDGGSATDKNGGDGGDVEKIVVEGAGFVRTIAAGNGGIPADLIDGRMGDGGSLKDVTFLGGTIGDFAAAFGTGGMGGLFAGDGDTTGDVTDVTASTISNIVASNATNPLLAKAAKNISGILASGPGIAIGSDLDDDGAFDFDDTVSPDGSFDPDDDAPIDGLVLAEALGSISGTALFTLETKTGDTTGTVDPN